MRLADLKLQNFRAFSLLRIHLHPRLNIFIGPNGCGKSSVLAAVCLLQANLAYRVVDLFLNDDQMDLKNQESKHFWIGLYQSDESQFPKLQATDIKNKTVGEFYISGAFSLDKEHADAYTFDYVHIPSDRTQIFDEDQIFIDHLKRLWKAKESVPFGMYLPVTRAILQAPKDEDNNWHNNHALAAFHHAFALEPNFKDFLQWFQFRENVENEIRLDQDSAFRDHSLEAVRRAISSVVPGFENHNLRVRRRSQRFVLTKNGQEFLLDQLSDGEKCFIAMVADIARRLAIANPHSENPLNESVLVMIDEVELHLHPGWQRIILPRLLSTFTGAQFLVTTHSPTVLSEIPNDQKKVWSLKMNEDGCAVATEIAESYGLEVNRIMEDLMEIPARPEQARDDIQKLTGLIQNADLQAAQTLLHTLQANIRTDDPDLVRAEILLRRKEAMAYAAGAKTAAPTNDPK